MVIVSNPDISQEVFGQCSQWCDSWRCPARGQELDSMILPEHHPWTRCSIQIRIFCDSHWYHKLFLGPVSVCLLSAKISLKYFSCLPSNFCKYLAQTNLWHGSPTSSVWCLLWQLNTITSVSLEFYEIICTGRHNPSRQGTQPALWYFWGQSYQKIKF